MINEKGSSAESNLEKPRKALVLASSSGLGRAVADELSKKNSKVFIHGRNQRSLQEVAKEIECLYGAWDLLEGGATLKGTEEAVKKLGGIDQLFINCGGPPILSFEAATIGDWVEAYQAIFLSAIEALQIVIPNMRTQNWGRIVVNTSYVAKEPDSRLIISSSLRAGVLGLVKALSHDLAADGITINAILPGFLKTERLASFGSELEKFTETIPARKIGSPHSFAELAGFLLNEESGYLTGQAIAFDGGLLKSF